MACRWVSGRLLLLVSGLANDVAKGKEYNGFMWDEQNMAAAERAGGNTIKLLVEHDEGIEVGRAVKFWQDEERRLWATAFIDCGTMQGANAALALFAGHFNGFSTGYSYDVETYQRTNKVVKHDFVEISLVNTPDDPVALLTDIVANDEEVLLPYLATWCDVLLSLSRLRKTQCGAGPQAEEFFFAHMHLQPWLEIMATALESGASVCDAVGMVREKLGEEAIEALFPLSVE